MENLLNYSKHSEILNNELLPIHSNEGIDENITLFQLGGTSYHSNKVSNSNRDPMA